MSKRLCELLWLKKLLTKIRFRPNIEMNLFCNNKTITISHIPVQHDHIKHIKLDILSNKISKR